VVCFFLRGFEVREERGFGKEGFFVWGWFGGGGGGGGGGVRFRPSVIKLKVDRDRNCRLVHPVVIKCSDCVKRRHRIFVVEYIHLLAFTDV